MFASILVFVGHFFEEISASASKHAFEGRLFTYAVYGLLVEGVSAVLYGATALIGGHSLVYDVHALPLLAVRMVFEIAQCEIVFRALALSDRTTFSFARILTIPLLLLVDIALGYTITNIEFLGIGIILTVLLAYFATGTIRGKGTSLALLSSLVSVVNVSLYKYDIMHYNSPAVVQFYVVSILFAIYAVRVLLSPADRALLVELKAHPLLGLTFVSQAFSSLLISFAYLYAPASLILAFSRACGVLWSMIAGVFYFHEHSVLKKAFVFAVLIVGLIVMVHK